MGYAPFGKKKCLVLPVNAGIDLDKEEYYHAFGIKTDEVDLSGLVLIENPDHTTEPVLVIDKENKVLYTAERAFSYADGLEEIDSSLIAEVIASGSIKNAKPIYCHPISLINNGVGSEIYLTCLIFNNSPDPIDTATKLKGFIDDIYQEAGDTVRIMVSGGVHSSSDIIIASFIGRTSANYFLYGVGVDGSEKSYGYTAGEFIDLFTAVIDGVNKIN